MVGETVEAPSSFARPSLSAADTLPPSPVGTQVPAVLPMLVLTFVRG
jgi:hypothetical protein